MAPMIYLSLVLLMYMLMETCHGMIRVKRVIGGEPDNSSDFGYLAILIGKKGYSWDVLNLWGEYKKIHCSGALISDQWVITAAHCFTLLKDVEEEKTYQNDEKPDDDGGDNEKDDDYSDNETLHANGKLVEKVKNLKEIIDFAVPNYWKVRLAVKTLEPTIGERFKNLWNRFMDKSTKKTHYKVSKIIRHPEYTTWNLENDIALIKLSEKLNITSVDSTKVIALSQNTIESPYWPTVGQICKVIGWGCTEFDGPMMDKPHSANLPILSPNYCRRVYRADINLTESQEFCAGYHDKNIGICPGDSGGPLVCNENGQQVLAGVVSATHKNDPSKYPGLFVRISYFRNWINRVMEEE